MNVAILRGRLSSPPRDQQLASGDRLVALEVTTRVDDGPGRLGARGLVPQRRPLPSTWEAGQEVLVVGRVRRRFFRAGGATASRTEVRRHAPSCRPAARRRRAKALEAAIEAVRPPVAG